MLSSAELEPKPDPELQAASKVKEVQEEVKQLEIESERQLQAKMDAAKQVNLVHFTGNFRQQNSLKRSFS